MKINYRDWNLRFPIVMVIFFCALTRCSSQGTLQITFDGPPIVTPGSQIGFRSYSESGMLFTPIDPNSQQFDRNGGGISFYPEDGTAYIQAELGESFMFRSVNGSPFGLDSVDLAEYSTVVPDAATVQFIGYYTDGSTVTTSFTTDGIIDGTGPLADFQTFNFNSKDWSGLTRVEIPSFGWSLDNLVVSVPEPSVFSLFGLGALGLMVRQFYRRKKA